MFLALIAFLVYFQERRLYALILSAAAAGLAWRAGPLPAALHGRAGAGRGAFLSGTARLLLATEAAAD